MKTYSDKTILIAEDNEVSFFLLKETLEPIKINVIRADNGLEAVRLFKEEDIDLVLMDIRMPYLNGMEALEEIRKISAEVPVYAQTAQVFPEEHSKYKDSGFNGVISKPIDLEMILEILEKELG